MCRIHERKSKKLQTSGGNVAHPAGGVHTIRVGYSLSDRGKSLMKILNALCVWGEENRR